MEQLTPDIRGRECHWHRYEVKYLVDELQAYQVRRFCDRYLPIDVHATGRSDRQYPIRSVCLDTPDHMLLDQAVYHEPYRFKLRVRSYHGPQGSTGSGPVFAEIKRRQLGIVQKTRAAIDAVTAAALLRRGDGGGAARAARHSPAMEEFLGTCRRIGARPAVGVFYLREAYEGHTVERVRITLDRGLHAGLVGPAEPDDGDFWQPVPTGGVILEGKFTNTYPFWLANMLHHLGLLRRGVCKYALCARAVAGTGRLERVC